jgi:hypothetical protein
VPRCYKKYKEDRLSQLNFEAPSCQDTSLGVEELNWGIRITEGSSVELKVWLWRKDFMCVIVPRYLKCIISYVKIRRQETDNGISNRLRTLVCAAMNCKVRRIVIALYYLKLRVECISAINPNIQSKPRLAVTNTHGNIRTTKIWVSVYGARLSGRGLGSPVDE